jgi:hypothetical protein
MLELRSARAPSPGFRAAPCQTWRVSIPSALGAWVSASAAYVAIAVGVLAVLAVLSLAVWRRGDRRLTPLAGLAVTCVVCGIVFGKSRLVGYASSWPAS